MILSYFCHGNPYTVKTTSLYWDDPWSATAFTCACQQPRSSFTYANVCICHKASMTLGANEEKLLSIIIWSFFVPSRCFYCSPFYRSCRKIGSTKRNCHAKNISVKTFPIDIFLIARWINLVVRYNWSSLSSSISSIWKDAMGLEQSIYQR